MQHSALKTHAFELYCDHCGPPPLFCGKDNYPSLIYILYLPIMSNVCLCLFSQTNARQAQLNTISHMAFTLIYSVLAKNKV